MMMMDVDPVQELHRAAEQGDIEHVKSALDAGLDGDSPDHDNNTALHIASANDHELIVAFLLSQNSNREATNNLGWTPLMQAARHGHMHVVLLLVQAGASVDTRNRFGMTALMLASVSGHMGTIRTLIEAGANFDPIPSINTCQITPLMIAVQHGNDAVVRLYLDKGVNANKSVPKTVITPLMFSAAGGNMSTAQILLDRGADPNALSACDLTALDVAATCNRPDIANFLQKKTTRQKKKGALCDIMDASRRGDVKAVQEILLADPSQCQVPTADGATPLMVAAMLGHMQVAQMLLQYGAHIDAQDHKNGWTALMQAIYHRETDMAKFLIQWGADISKISHKGYTAFDIASETLNIDVMRSFVEVQMLSLGIGSPSPTPQPGWSQQSGSSADLPDGRSKHGLKQWWNRVSNRSTSPEQESLKEISTMSPLPPIQYDPILPQEIRLPPVMDFGAGSIHATETMKSMVPPHISPTGGKPGLVPKAMPPGRKILPGGPVEPPRHATNSRLLKWSMGSGGSSPGSSLSGLSPQSSGEARGLGSILQVNGPKRNGNSDGRRERNHGKYIGENDVLVSSLDSGGSGGSSLKTVTSSKSSRSTAVLIPHVSEESDGTTSAAASHLTLSLGSGQLSEVLQKLALNQYLELFLEQEVDLDAFLELSDADLQDLGINTASARNKILRAIASLKTKL
ncbi:Ankyrin repeat and SAM domain-containing protein 6-like [Homarus americanus]|uniref:Ankyrin repeat and SAM domain-containing protein 6-like n=1 Tax=Homarus americanus TaxID=6706 RepID=A0A8J5N165_HOMAM|nr:Ankyrin repeat and SAM domain-containing protein 6-like [Homarus americanus]